MGYRTIIKDIHGNVLSDTIDADLATIQAERIQDLKDHCTRAILETYPEHKQRNASMGIYDSSTNAEIIAFVKKFQQQFQSLKANVLACTSQEQVVAIGWSNPV